MDKQVQRSGLAGSRAIPIFLLTNVAGEFGAALLLISITIALYFWRRRDEVEGDNRPASTC
jgi:hypothetical protein